MGEGYFNLGAECHRHRLVIVVPLRVVEREAGADQE
jgi:hypothetical protein